MAAMSEVLFRVVVFAGLLLLLALVEWRWPRNRANPARGRRWPVNLGLGMLNTVLLRLLTPVLAYFVAIWAEDHGVGLFNNLAVPAWLSVVASLLLLDMTIYWQHRLMHVLPWLWRLHRVHHTDVALDVTSGLRFHPLEILFSLAVKVSVVLVLGAPAVAVLVFEVLLSSFSLFTHTNFAIPTGVDRVLRALVVTPDMHRIHHSVLREEHDRNYGFNLSCWDHLFASYRDQPGQSQADLRLGLEQFRQVHEQRFPALLSQPFKNE